MRTSRKLEELLKMAETNPLSQKPAEALGSLADKFIEAYAKSMPGRAFNEGMRLGDETLTLAAIKQMVEQDYRCESVIDAYKYSKKHTINSDLEYGLRRRVLENYPGTAYGIDFEAYNEKAENSDRIDLWRLNKDLMESREYFAGLAPDSAIMVGSESVDGSDKDPILVALAKPYQLIKTMLDDNLEHANQSHGVVALKIAEACLKFLSEGDRKEPESRVEIKKERLAALAYRAAHNTGNLQFRERATKYFVETNPLAAASFALQYGNPKLAELSVRRLLGSGDFYFSDDSSFSKCEGNLAYELAKKHKLDSLAEITGRIVTSNPAGALNYGLKHGDAYLVGEARKKLGKKVSRQAVRLFQQNPKREKE